jgi:2-oxo-4-hydroxy-4-carboxy-5-ureidoimidazoline decarboxylase
VTESWLATLNDGVTDGVTDDALAEALAACCSSRRWVAEILRHRPFADADALLSASDAAIEGLDEAALADALAGHPRIGERPAGAGGEWSRQEQSGVTSAADVLLDQLATANAEYERRFGHVYLVCATGKSAQELLAICQSRLSNDPVTEERIVRVELAKITRIRLGRLLHPYDAP